MSTLQLEPFNLLQGQEVVVKVAATNSIGNSAWSQLSSVYPIVALIQTIPHKPESKPQRGPQTTTTQIHVLINSLTGLVTGGAPILSYEINYDSGTSLNEWTPLKGFFANDLSLFYIYGGLMINMPFAVKYRVKNIFGWSEYSDHYFIYTIMSPD